MASPAQAPKPAAGGILQRLPKLSTAVWMIIVGCLLVIFIVPLVMNYFSEVSQQSGLRANLAQLQTKHADLTTKIATQTALAGDVAKFRKEAQALKAAYRKVTENPDIAQDIVSLAWDQDITITGMAVSANVGKLLGTDFPFLTYSCSLSGQVANFQNLLIAIGNRYPSSRATLFSISPAQLEGELDLASLVISIYCDKDN